MAVAPRARRPSLVKKRSRAVDRLKWYTLPAVRAAHAGRALSEVASVQERTRIDYAKRIKTFVEQAQTGPIQHMKAEHLDRALVDYFDEELLAGECDVANRLLAALAVYHPAYSRKGDFDFPRVCRAANGWKRLAPCLAGLPMPHEGMWAIVGAVVAVGDRMAALVIAIGFYCCMRTGELFGLTAGQLIAPLPPSPVESRCWDLMRGLSKLGMLECNESVLLDVPQMAWADAYLRELSRLRPATAKIWPFDTSEFCMRYVAAGRAAGVEALGLYPPASGMEARHGTHWAAADLSR